MLAAAGKAKALGRGRDLSCMIRILCKPREFVLGINGSRAVEAKENKVWLQYTMSQNAFTVFIIKTNMVHNLSTPFASVDVWPFILFLSETYNLFENFISCILSLATQGAQKVIDRLPFILSKF